MEIGDGAVKIHETVVLAVPIERMYEAVSDIEDIGWCVAGVKQVKATGPDDSLWKVEARAGFMARTFDIQARIVERRPPEHLAFVGTGQDLVMSGHLNLRSLAPDQTECEIEVDAQVTGPFSSIVDLMARGPQQQLIRQTIANLRRKLEGEAA
jgi:carbon monoxide dehydrogenase subunit G